MSGHTLGPWFYSFEGEPTAFIVEEDGTTVAKLSTTYGSTANTSLAVNVRLIAAAPDLLAALDEARTMLAGHENWEALARMDAALRKAGVTA